MPAGALRSDGPLVCFYESLANSQSKPQASQLCPPTLFKGVEDFRQLFLLDSHAGVDDFHMQLSTGIVTCRDGNLSVLRSKFHRIIYEVPKNLLQSRRVCAHVHFLRAREQRMRQVLSIDFGL